MPLKFRRGEPAPTYVLEDAEPGWDSVNKVFKIGDGHTTWENLGVIGSVTDEVVAEAVAEYLADNPEAITEYVDSAILVHANDETPHRAYDVDMPSITLLYENGLV